MKTNKRRTKEQIKQEQEETNTGQDIERESKEQKQILNKYNGEEIKTHPTF